MPSTLAPSEGVTIDATYYDGKTTRPLAVRIEVGINDLDITDAAGGFVARWLLSDIRLVEKPAPGEAPRLRCGFAGDDRLTLATAADLDRLRGICPNLDRTAPRLAEAGRPLVLWGLAAVASVVLVVVLLLPRFAAEVAALVPAPALERLGAATEAQVLDLVRVIEGRGGNDPRCRGAAGEVALRALTQRLMDGLAAPMDIRVSVVDSRIVNAMALPGRRVVLFRGMIEAAANGAEGAEALAGILAHEISHVRHRDATALTIEHAGLALLTSLVVGDAAGGLLIAGLGRMALGAAHAREAERRADAEAVQLLNRAGIRGRPLAGLLGRVAKEKAAGAGNGKGDRKGDGEFLGLLETHPGGAERTAAIEHAATGHGAAMNAAEWAALRDICSG